MGMVGGVSYISASRLVAINRHPKVAVVDVRDEERSYDAHIAGSHHCASTTFGEKMPELLQVLRGKDTIVFHCALSQVRGPSCARLFLDYLSQVKYDTSVQKVMVLERGFNGWQSSGKPVCRCTDLPCSGEQAEA